MEWSRAKNLILILLLFLNVFLLFSVLSEYRTEAVSRETLANMVSILKSRGVDVGKADIPAARRGIPRMIFGDACIISESEAVDRLMGKGAREAGSDDDMDAAGIGDTENSASEASKLRIYKNGNKEITFDGRFSFIYINTTPEDRVEVLSERQADVYIKNFLKRHGFGRYEFQLDATPSRTGGFYVYVQKYQGYLVYENKLRVAVSRKGVTFLELKCRQIKGLTQELKGEIAGVYEVLLENFNRQDTTGIVIESVDIGYKDDVDSEATQTSEVLPVWRIRIEGQKQPRYFDAVSGRGIPV